MRKKLAIFLYSLGSGGAEKVASVLAKEFLKKYDTTLILMNDTIFYNIPKNIKIIYLEKSNPRENGILKLLKLPVLAWKYRQICKKLKIDLSFSLMNRPNYINILAKLFGNGAKTIVAERGMPSVYYKNNLQGKISKFLIKKLYPKADKVVANSKESALDIMDQFGVKNVFSIYNPLLPKVCNGQKSDGFAFVSIGRFDEGKNHKLLIDSFAELDLNAELWLIGEGSLKKEMQTRVLDLGMGGKIKFLGRKKDIYKLLNMSDCFVFGSSYEGFPNVLLEALECGLPVVSTDCKSGPREILSPKSDFKKHTDSIKIVEFGILVKIKSKKYFKKAMRLIFEDESLRYNFKQQAKLRALDFDIGKIVKEWERVFDE